MMAKFLTTTDIAGFFAPLDPALLSDFLKLASYLYSEGYEDAAAVICRSLLESHLRKLAEKLAIAGTTENGLPKKADALNGELAASGAYSTLVQEKIAAWLDPQNHAVRGEYDRYARDQVAVLLDGVRELLDRYPA